MNKKLTIIALLLIISAFILLLAPYTSDTEIFTPKDIQGTEQNLNPAALKQISSEKSVETLKVMQEFIDLSGTIIINLRSNNIDGAKEDLDDYRENLGKFENMIINLDMTESEIEEYRKNNREELENLETLTEQLEGLDELEKLKIQYQDSDDPDRYYSVTYEIEKIRQDIREKKGELLENTDKKIELSEKYELQINNLKETTGEIENIGFEDDNKTLKPSTDISGNPSANIQLNKLTSLNIENTDSSWDLFINTTIFTVIIILFALAGYIYYNKKSKPKKNALIIHSKGKKTGIKKKKTGLSSIIKESTKLISQNHENEACRILIKNLFHIISQKTNIHYKPSMTNYEFISKLPKNEDLILLCSLYEKIVYSGKATQADKNRLFEIFNQLMNHYNEELL